MSRGDWLTKTFLIIVNIEEKQRKRSATFSPFFEVVAVDLHMQSSGDSQRLHKWPVISLTLHIALSWEFMSYWLTGKIYHLWKLLTLINKAYQKLLSNMKTTIRNPIKANYKLNFVNVYSPNDVLKIRYLYIFFLPCDTLRRNATFYETHRAEPPDSTITE